MQERREAGRRESGLEGDRKGGIRNCMDPVLEGYRKRGIQDWRDSGLEGYGIGGKKKRGFRTGGMWKRRDAGQDG